LFRSGLPKIKQHKKTKKIRAERVLFKVVFPPKRREENEPKKFKKT